MKRIVFLVIATLLAIGLILPGCVPSTFTIVSIAKGDVFVMKAGTDDWIEGEVGMSLKDGDRIKTGDDSDAEITFSNGSTIQLQAGTQVEFVAIPTDTRATTIAAEQAIRVSNRGQ